MDLFLEIPRSQSVGKVTWRRRRAASSLPSESGELVSESDESTHFAKPGVMAVPQRPTTTVRQPSQNHMIWLRWREASQRSSMDTGGRFRILADRVLPGRAA